VLIFALMMLVTADVTLRFVLRQPIPGVVEIVEMSIVGIVFLQVTHAMAEGKMIRSDTFLAVLLLRAPRWGHFLDAAGQLVGALLMAIILWGQVPRLAQAWTEDSFKGNPGLFTAPTWPLELMIALGCAAALVQFVIQFVRACRGWRNRTVIGGRPE
jgi:TRAP-type C4-dicarboxylate transport system permease small subunit